MKRASMTEVRRDSLVKRKKGPPLIITRQRKAVAALVYLAGDAASKAVITTCAPKLHEILDRARTRLRRKRGISHDQFWKEVETGKKGKSKRKSA